MKKSILSILCAVSLFASAVPSVFADKVAVVGDLVFIANGSVTVKNISDGLANQCLASPLVDILGNPVANATDIVIAGSNAIVTASATVEGVSTTDAAIVDISSCLTAQATVPVTECISTVDLNEGLLIIPCVEVDGKVVTVHMEQRGNSSNWEVKFLGDNINFKDDDDDEEDDDDNDNKDKHK